MSVPVPVAWKLPPAVVTELFSKVARPPAPPVPAVSPIDSGLEVLPIVLPVMLLFRAARNVRLTGASGDTVRLPGSGSPLVRTTICSSSTTSRARLRQAQATGQQGRGC